MQNNFYSHVLVRSQVQENARAINEVLATELRNIGSGSIATADSADLVVKYPMTMAFVCGNGGASDVTVHIPGGITTMDSSDVSGYGYRSPSTGTWTYYAHAWSALLSTSGGTSYPAGRCANNGADTSGIVSQFRRIKTVESDTGVNNTTLDNGDVAILFYRTTEYKFAASTLVAGDRALWRAVNGGSLVEFATGLKTTSKFYYRRGGTTWYTYVAPANLSTIDAIRVDIQSQGKGTTSSELTYDFGWTVDIPLANAF